MELPLGLQAAQFGLSLAVGAGLGLCYDLLRLLRRSSRLTHLADLLFVLLLLPTLLLETLYVGRGELRLFLLTGTALGAWLYFLILSRPLTAFLTAVFRLLLRPLRALGRGMCRIEKNFKEKEKI